MNSTKKVKPFTMSIKGRSITYAPRYGVDVKSINRTLTILLAYNKNFADLIGEQILLWKDDGESLVHVVCALDLPTYRHEISISEALKILRSKNEFQTYFKEWEETKTKGHKRLWAALRDYRKSKSVFCEYLKNALDPGLASLWNCNRFPLDQLELPGDIWNERMNKSLIIHLAEKAGIEVKREKAIKNRL